MSDSVLEIHDIIHQLDITSEPTPTLEITETSNNLIEIVGETESTIEINQITNEISVTEVSSDVVIEINVPTSIDILEMASQGPSGADGTNGSQGPQGIQGLPGLDGDKTYVHTQTVAANIWTVTHNLNKRPSITIVDSGENMVIGDVEYLDLNSLRVMFTNLFGGKCYLN